LGNFTTTTEKKLNQPKDIIAKLKKEVVFLDEWDMKKNKTTYQPFELAEFGGITVSHQVFVKEN
jgi:hypothetical protein